KRALSLFYLESDRRSLDGNHLADQLHEICDRTPLFASIDAEKRLFLLLCGPFVDVDDGTPITFQYIAGNVHDESQSETRDIDTVDLPLFEMMSQRRIASSPVWIDADPARTEDFTVANFEQTSFKFVGHKFFLSPNSLENIGNGRSYPKPRAIDSSRTPSGGLGTAMRLLP